MVRDKGDISVSCNWENAYLNTTLKWCCSSCITIFNVYVYILSIDEGFHEIHVLLIIYHNLKMFLQIFCKPLHFFIQGDSKMLSQTWGVDCSLPNKVKKSMHTSLLIWISAWSAHSPKISLLDFGPQGHLKQLVYGTCLHQECLLYKPTVLVGFTDKTPKDWGSVNVQAMKPISRALILMTCHLSFIAR